MAVIDKLARSWSSFELRRIRWILRTSHADPTSASASFSHIAPAICLLILRDGNPRRSPFGALEPPRRFVKKCHGARATNRKQVRFLSTPALKGQKRQSFLSWWGRCYVRVAAQSNSEVRGIQHADDRGLEVFMPSQPFRDGWNLQST